MTIVNPVHGITAVSTTSGGGGSGSTLSSGNIFVGSVSNVAAGVAVTGDIVLTNTGVMTVTSVGGIAAANLLAKTLSSANLFVGNVSNIATGVAITGDISITNTGVVTISSIGSAGAIQAQVYAPINTQTGTTYTLALTDNGKWVTMANVSAITLTIPTSASVAFPTNSEVMLSQLGAGSVTITGAGGVTVNTLSTLIFSGQYGVAALKKTASDTWVAFGALA